MVYDDDGFLIKSREDERNRNTYQQLFRFVGVDRKDIHLKSFAGQFALQERRVVSMQFFPFKNINTGGENQGLFSVENFPSYSKLYRGDGNFINGDQLFAS